ncbi:MAG: 4Fe-4S binding protein [bacterium]
MSLFSMSGLVLKWMLRKPYTHCYPTEPRQPFPGSRGALAIHLPTCTFCGICAKRCPTQALTVNRAARHWTIDRLRCISCDYCAEHCPKKCLSLTTAHGIPTVTRDREVFVAPAPAPAPTGNPA